jgi:hypothetical protein
MKICSAGKLALAIALAATLGSGTAHAQFGGLLNSTSPAPAPNSGVNKADFGRLLDKTAAYVLAARIEFIGAQIDLSAALGLKTDALTKASEGLRAVEGPSSSAGDKVKAIKDSSKVSESARKEESARMAQSDELTAESKVKFGQGSLKFVKAIILEKRQIDSIQKLVAQGKALVASANFMDKLQVMRSVVPATQMAFMVPGDVQEGFTTFGQITDYAQKHNISVPSTADAEKELGDGP